MIDLKKCKRILVLGCSGSGKSTLTRNLSGQLNLPAVHLDSHFWLPNWTETEASEWPGVIEGLVAEDAWIMDGNWPRTFDIRMPRTEAVIVVNMPWHICQWRVLKRRIQYHGQTRPSLAEGCEEKVDWEFYKYIWSFNQRVLPRIKSAIDEYGLKEKTVFLETPQQVDKFLLALNA